MPAARGDLRMTARILKIAPKSAEPVGVGACPIRAKSWAVAEGDVPAPSISVHRPRCGHAVAVGGRLVLLVDRGHAAPVTVSLEMPAARAFEAEVVRAVSAAEEAVAVAVAKPG